MQSIPALIAAGDLEAALQNTQASIRQNPADAKLRIVLFQLHCVLGNWDKALNQLTVIRELDKASLLMVQTYQPVLMCEALRKQVFSGNQTPLVLGKPQDWLALLIEALKLDSQNQAQQAAALRTEALAQAPATSGFINGEAFGWIADADNRLGPVLEVMLNGRYYWVPFEHIREINLEKPADLRDLVWMPAQFTWNNGGQATGFIPTRYPGSELAEDNRIRLARLTEWQEAEGGSRSLGQRLLATDQSDYALLDIRKIELAASTEAS